MSPPPPAQAQAESKLPPRFIGVYLGVERVARRPWPHTWLPAREDSVWFPQIPFWRERARQAAARRKASGSPRGVAVRQHPHRMIWLVKLRLSSLCGRTIEFKMSTSAGIRTRQPEAWARSPGAGHERYWGRGAGAMARPSRGSPPCCPPVPPPWSHPPVTHVSWVHGRSLVNVC